MRNSDPTPANISEETRHASCVMVDGNAVLFIGPSGSGKSTLALKLLALGAYLVSDDQTRLIRRGDSIIASAPDPIRGLIEARGVGLLPIEPVREAAVTLVVDLGAVETTRLPEKRCFSCLDLSLPLLRKVEEAHFAATILLILRHGGPIDT